MPTNKLRRHARELLSLAIKAHDDGHIGDARSLTSRASEEKHEPVSDIDTAAADSLKVLDPKRPIREADITERN